MKITKSILSKEMAILTGIPDYVAKKQVNQVFELLRKSVLENEKVMISGLGTFELQTGNVVFLPSKKLKMTERSEKMQLKGVNKKGKLYEFITEGYKKLALKLGTEDLTSEVGMLLEYYGLDEVYDDRFYEDKDSVYSFIEILLAYYINAKGERELFEMKCERLRKENISLEKRIKEAERKLSALQEAQELRGGDK